MCPRSSVNQCWVCGTMYLLFTGLTTNNMVVSLPQLSPPMCMVPMTTSTWRMVMFSRASSTRSTPPNVSKNSLKQDLLKPASCISEIMSISCSAQRLTFTNWCSVFNWLLVIHLNLCARCREQHPLHSVGHWIPPATVHLLPGSGPPHDLGPPRVPRDRPHHPLR